MKIKPNLLIIALLIFSFFIRVYKIDNLPLFGDELDVGYQAYSLGNTFHDYKGNFLPTYTQSLSESRAPLLIYSTIPFIKLFGLNEYGVRLAPIIFGVLSVLFLYKLILLTSKNKTLALLSGAILSIIPWHFHYSRIAFEATLLLFLLLLGSYLFYLFVIKKKNIYVYLSIISFSLTFYTYNTANIFTPLISLSLLATNFDVIKQKIKPLFIFKTLIFTLILISPILLNIISGKATNRFKLISIFNDPQNTNEIVFKRTGFSSTTSSFKEKLFHNKPLTWIKKFSSNYLTAISPSFIFDSGDPNPRHSIPKTSLIIPIFFLLLIMGLFKINLKQPLNVLMLSWFIFAPIPASLTVGGSNHATRLFLLVIPLSYFIAFGLIQIINLKNKVFKFLSLVCILLFSIISIFSYVHEYFNHYPKETFESWYYGYKEVFQSIPETKNHLYISNRTYSTLLPYLFYQKYNPETILQTPIDDTEKSNIKFDLNGFSLNQNTFFINNWNQTEVLNKITTISETNDVFVLYQLSDIPGDWNLSNEPLKGFKTINTVYNPNNTIYAQIIQKQ